MYSRAGSQERTAPFLQSGGFAGEPHPFRSRAGSRGEPHPFCSQAGSRDEPHPFCSRAGSRGEPHPFSVIRVSRLVLRVLRPASPVRRTVFPRPGRATRSGGRAPPPHLPASKPVQRRPQKTGGPDENPYRRAFHPSRRGLPAAPSDGAACKKGVKKRRFPSTSGEIGAQRCFPAKKRDPQDYPRRLPGIISRKGRADRLKILFSLTFRFLIVISADGSFRL